MKWKKEVANLRGGLSCQGVEGGDGGRERRSRARRGARRGGGKEGTDEQAGPVLLYKKGNRMCPGEVIIIIKLIIIGTK